MMEPLGYAGNTLGQTACEDRPYLARIADAADELDRIAGYIENFIDRCRGGGGSGAKLGAPTAVPSGHFGQLERLQDNLGRVDKLARELQTIG
jgi:hypothetical protein